MNTSLSLLAQELRVGLARVDSLDPHEDIHSGDARTEGRAGGLAWSFPVLTAPKAPHPRVLPDPLPQLALVILTRCCSVFPWGPVASGSGS